MDDDRTRIEAVEEVLRAEGWGEETAHNMARALVPLSEEARARLGVRLLGKIQRAEPEERASFPPPRSIGEILAGEKPEVPWLAEGLIPAGGNVIIGGYPKSHKTNFVLELAVALATGTPFLGKFNTPPETKVGIALMEGGEWIQANRLHRLAQARGLKGEHLDGLIHLWHRPPLRLSNPIALLGLGHFVEEHDLGVMFVDPFAYVVDGVPSRSEEMIPQLMAYSALRNYREGLTTGFTHHAKKDSANRTSDRLTDILRDSTAIPGWYDCGIVLERKDETSPVKVRTELRDHLAPDAFAFTVEDEIPAGPENEWTAEGWLRLQVSDLTPQTLNRRADAEKMISPVLEFVQENPGCSKNKIRKRVKGDNWAIDIALNLLQEQGRIHREDPTGPGKGSHIYPALREVA